MMLRENVRWTEDSKHFALRRRRPMAIWSFSVHWSSYRGLFNSVLNDKLDIDLVRTASSKDVRSRKKIDLVAQKH